MQVLLNIYRFIFCRKIFYKFNYHLYKLALRGIGILNSEGPKVTGETFLLKKLKKSFSFKTIIDVGANDGGFAAEIRGYFPNASIYAVEPHPETFKRLSKVAKEKKIFAFNIGLGNHTEKGYLWDFADNANLKSSQPTSTLASGIKDVIEELHKQKAKAYEFKMDTLDNFAKKEKIKKIDFLKIDIEGNELSVLEGAKNLIKGNKISLIEFEFNEMNAYSRTFFKDFINLLPNFKFYRIMPKGLYKLGPYKPITHEIFAFQNILAVKKGLRNI
ncbi:MAG: hypothetical protein A2W22_06600 [Candidatus Levybacteria bacterium RBG_16_35_11]|nr:MAG: hypothetical protein A2W22_06600 [Candidatus Levybacteria bacterium RBG_16_35_11]